jgi:hypothetical protein
LSELVELGKPSWSWPHRTWVQLSLGLITILVPIVAVQTALSPWWRAQPLAGE